MIIDSHVHTFPDKIALKTVEKLAGISGIAPCTNGTVANTRELLNKHGISGAMLLNIATKPEQQISINNSVTALNGKNGFIALGSVHFRSTDWMEQLVFLKESGVPGVKLHPDYQGFMIDQPDMFNIYAACQELGLFVVFHAGWDCYSPNLVHAHPKNCADVARAFPKLKMVIAHMGGLRMEQAVLEHLAGAGNVYFDTAMAATYNHIDLTKKIIQKHGVSRILFGSDCPWENPINTLNFVDSLHLSSDERQAVFSENVLNLISGGKP